MPGDITDNVSSTQSSYLFETRNNRRVTLFWLTTSPVAARQSRRPSSHRKRRRPSQTSRLSRRRNPTNLRRQSRRPRKLLRRWCRRRNHSRGTEDASESLRSHSHQSLHHRAHRVDGAIVVLWRCSGFRELHPTTESGHCDWKTNGSECEEC